MVTIYNCKYFKDVIEFDLLPSNIKFTSQQNCPENRHAKNNNSKLPYSRKIKTCK